MSTRSQYRGAEVGHHEYATVKMRFQFGTERWQRTGVANVIR